MQELEQVGAQADVIIIDEAHHFRNTGTRGEEGKNENRDIGVFMILPRKKICICSQQHRSTIAYSIFSI